jgi:hypothetical protein
MMIEILIPGDTDSFFQDGESVAEFRIGTIGQN